MAVLSNISGEKMVIRVYRFRALVWEGIVVNSFTTGEYTWFDMYGIIDKTKIVISEVFD